MRKRVLAMVLAGLMMFETGNVAIASEIKGTVTQQDVIQEISDEMTKKTNTSEEEQSLETNQEGVTREEEQKPEITEEKEQKPETGQKEIIQEEEQEPESIQEEEQNPERAKDVQNREIPNISQVKTQELEPGDIYEAFICAECKFDKKIKDTIENVNLYEEEEDSEAYVLHLKSNKRAKFDFKLALENNISKEIATKADIGIYKVNQIGNAALYSEYEIIKKIWHKQTTVGLEEISLQKEVSLETGTYLIVFAKTDIAGDRINYEFSVKDTTTFATSISMQKKMYLLKNKKATIQVSKVKPLDAELGITWESDDEDIATVDKNGKVTGKRAGRCEILATLQNGKEYTCNVYVEDPKFTTNKYVLNKGESQNLKVRYVYQPITWKSSDNKIVKVDQKGKITAKKKGKAKIYAKVGDKTINCSIQVDEPKLNSKSVKMVKGGHTTLKVTGTKQKIKWSSSDKRIAVVKDGKVTGKKVGKTTITAKIGTSKYTCKVAIVETKLKTTSMKIAVNGKRPISTKKKETKIKWSSDNKKIATVNSNGMVTGKKKGTAVITAKIKDVNYTCKVTVENPKLSKKSISLEYGKNTVLKVKDTTMNAKWSSSNSGVASVNAKGKVVGKSRGSAVITAKIGGKTLTCKVRVRGKYPNYSITMGDDIDYNCAFIILAIQNKGIGPMRVYSKNASLVNPYYTYYNRSLTLVNLDDALNHDKITPISYVDIQPGEITYLVYVVNGTNTIYNYSSSVYFDFSYEGENYRAYNNRNSGYSYSRK